MQNNLSYNIYYSLILDPYVDPVIAAKALIIFSCIQFENTPMIHSFPFCIMLTFKPWLKALSCHFSSLNFFLTLRGNFPSRSRKVCRNNYGPQSVVFMLLLRFICVLHCNVNQNVANVPDSHTHRRIFSYAILNILVNIPQRLVYRFRKGVGAASR